VKVVRTNRLGGTVEASRRGSIAAGLALTLALAGCGKTETVTVPPTAPPPAQQTLIPRGESGGEEGIAVRRRLSSGVRAAIVPHFRPATGCGVERWAVKTLTDPGASRVVLTPKPATVATLGSIAAPKDPTDRLAPTETTVYRLTGVRMTAFKQEDDSDIHLAVEDDNGHTMIAEFPAATCDTTAAPKLRAMMKGAHDDFVAACGQPAGRYKKVTGTATLTGVGFFDRIHGQRGVAPNGIELHPVLSFATDRCGS
jgi:hypothetical protein